VRQPQQPQHAQQPQRPEYERGVGCERGEDQCEPKGHDRADVDDDQRLPEQPAARLLRRERRRRCRLLLLLSAAVGSDDEAQDELDREGHGDQAVEHAPPAPLHVWQRFEHEEERREDDEAEGAELEEKRPLRGGGPVQKVVRDGSPVLRPHERPSGAAVVAHHGYRGVLPRQRR